MGERGEGRYYIPRGEEEEAKLDVIYLGRKEVVCGVANL